MKLEELLNTNYITESSYSRKYRLFVLCNYYSYLNFKFLKNQCIQNQLENNNYCNNYGNNYNYNNGYSVEQFVYYLKNNSLCWYI